MSKYYIARDKDRELWLYSEKPRKTEHNCWRGYSGVERCIDNDVFSEVKWEDKEPKVITIEESPWIKVEDRLPPVDETVLCICKYRTVSNSYFHLVNSIDKDNNWTMKCFAFYDIIAWMPIPEFKE